MASLSDELICSICLDIYKDPVMLPCGHNFCQECIKHALDFHHQSRIYTCPECRTVFQQRPVLLRNLKLGPIIQHVQEDSRKKLQQSLLDLTSERKATEKRLESLNEGKSKIEESSKALEKAMNMSFMMILKDIKKSRKTVLEEISRKKEHALMQVSRLTLELEIRKQELSKRIHEMEKMLQAGDLRTVQRPEIERGYHQRDGVAVDLDEMPIIWNFKRSLSRASCMCSELIQSIPEPKTTEILLDVKTACNYILVSPDRKSASYISVDQRYPEGPERFEVCQVLSSCSLSAQNYWVVDVSTAKEWIVGVAYHSMDRKTLDDDSYIGFNKKSWGLEYRHSLSALHNKVREEVPLSSPVELLGVYVNYNSGIISFYRLGHHFRHLCSFFATFTDNLHAAFYVFPDSCITVHKKEPWPKSRFVK